MCNNSLFLSKMISQRQYLNSANKYGTIVCPCCGYTGNRLEAEIPEFDGTTAKIKVGYYCPECWSRWESIFKLKEYRLVWTKFKNGKKI